MDVIGSSSNEEAHEAAFEALIDPTKTMKIDLFERYTFALCQAKQTNEKVLKKLLSIAQKSKVTHEKISQTLTLTVATLSRKSADNSIKASVMKWLVDSLVKCANPECHQNYLRALKNTENPAMIPILMQLIESQGLDKKSALLGLEILAKFDSQVIKSKVKHLDQHLLTLIMDPSKDLSLKSIAIEMMMINYPLEHHLRDIIKVLKESQNKELTAIVLQKWAELAAGDPYLLELFRYLGLSMI